MSALPLPAWLVLAAGIVLGILGDVLLRAPGAPGLNMFLWIAGVAAATLLLQRRGGRELSTEARLLLGVAVLFAAGLAWRDSPPLKLLSLFCAGVALGLPALRGGAAWIRHTGVAGYVTAVARTGVRTAYGAAPVLRAVDRETVRSERSGARVRHLAAVARGVALATPFIVIFGGLFISADAVFARLVEDTLRVDLPTVASHVVLAGFLAWVATGYVGGFLTGTGPAQSRAPVPGGVLGTTEVGIALGLIDALFLAFVLVQFRYLFGGSALVEVTPGLTYAEYARHGFFELVAVVALTVPVLLSADWLLRRTGPRDERIFRALAAAQILLVLATALSALQRMRLYQDAYGLTELRFHATALLLLLTFILLWLAATVLRGRRNAFAFGTLAASMAAAAVLLAVNPDAVIARTNVARALSGQHVETPFDVVYATTLSADAVPVLIPALPSLPADARCRIAQRLLDRWPPAARIPLRSWSWSEMRARQEVRRHEAALRAAAAGC